MKSEPQLIAPSQCRAARGLLGWTQQDLADKSGVSLSTVRDFETGRRTLRGGKLKALTETLQSAGITLITEDTAGVGVRFSRPERRTRNQP